MNAPYHTKALTEGFLLREWRLEKVLGVGGFGIVYQGRGVYFDETVAIKEYFPTAISTRLDTTQVAPNDSSTEEIYALGLNKFMEEAKVLWNLSKPSRHPNVVSVKSLFELNGTAYMVMDFESGASLSQQLKEGRAFTEAELRAIIEPIADGLARAHASGVLHRDIKPANILVDGDGRAVLIDFGSARFDAGQATSTKVTFYTPPYAALEQYVKSYEQGPWTDIYALGVTLYECVTGAKPADVLERLHGSQEEPLGAQGRPGFNRSFLRAIDAAMAIRPAERPQTLAAWLALFDAPEPEVGSETTQIAIRSDLHLEPPVPDAAAAAPAPERENAVPAASDANPDPVVAQPPPVPTSASAPPPPPSSAGCPAGAPAKTTAPARTTAPAPAPAPAPPAAADPARERPDEGPEGSSGRAFPLIPAAAGAAVLVLCGAAVGFGVLGRKPAPAPQAAALQAARTAPAPPGLLRPALPAAAVAGQATPAVPAPVLKVVPAPEPPPQILAFPQAEFDSLVNEARERALPQREAESLARSGHEIRDLLTRARAAAAIPGRAAEARALAADADHAAASMARTEATALRRDGAERMQPFEDPYVRTVPTPAMLALRSANLQFETARARLFVAQDVTAAVADARAAIAGYGGVSGAAATALPELVRTERQRVMAAVLTARAADAEIEGAAKEPRPWIFAPRAQKDAWRRSQDNVASARPLQGDIDALAQQASQSSSLEVLKSLLIRAQGLSSRLAALKPPPSTGSSSRS